MLQWLNISAYRTSHYPYARQFYDMADQLGIVHSFFHFLNPGLCSLMEPTQVIIDECPAVGMHDPSFFNPTTLSHHKQVITSALYFAYRRTRLDF